VNRDRQHQVLAVTGQLHLEGAVLDVEARRVDDLLQARRAASTPIAPASTLGMPEGVPIPRTGRPSVGDDRRQAPGHRALASRVVGLAALEPVEMVVEEGDVLSSW
jgi:hypothetical protein